MESFLGPLAQWLEPPAHNRLVLGSSPRWPTNTEKKTTAKKRWSFLREDLAIGKFTLHHFTTSRALLGGGFFV